MNKRYFNYFLTHKFSFGMSLCGLLLAGGLTSCDLFEYHPYSGKIEGENQILAKNIPLIEAIGSKSPYKFAFITDTQRNYDDTEDAVNLINARGDIDFVVHGGDMTDFGATKEFEWMRDELSRLKMPYVTVIGNHDCLGHGEHIYEYLYGPDNYAFTVGHTRFECLNTIALEYDYSNPVPDFAFLENEIQYINDVNEASADSLTQTIFVMHSRPTDEQFNNNVARAFDFYLKNFPGMEEDAPAYDESVTADTLLLGTRRMAFCLNGHNHRYEVLDIFDDGILYYGCANIHKRQYFVFTIKEDGYECECIDF